MQPIYSESYVVFFLYLNEKTLFVYKYFVINLRAYLNLNETSREKTNIFSID